MNPQQARERIREYQSMTGRDLRDITAQGAKIAAEWLAEVTPPRGKNATARKVGIGAIARDFGKLFPVNPWNFLRRTHGRDTADRFWAQYQAWRGKSKRHRAASWGDIISALSGTRVIAVSGADGIKAAHKSARRNGRTNTSTVYFAQNQRDVTKYQRDVEKRVGYSKGGWAAAARQLGNSRLPAWMSGPGRGTVRSDANGHAARAENLAKWAEQVTPSSQKSMADQIAQRRVMSMMSAAIKAIRARTVS